MAKKGEILVIDDEKPIQKFLRIALENEDFQVHSAYNAEDGIRILAHSPPDLVLLDVFLPDKNGFEVLTSVREWSQVPVIVLSVEKGEREIIKFLDGGANDYITKPFAPGELMARVRAALRQSFPKEGSVLRSGRVAIDFSAHIVTVDEKEVKLTRIEYNILKLLAYNGGKVVTQTHIMREIWGEGKEMETNLLRVYVANLRKKIEKNPQKPEYIITEPAVGYRFLLIP